MPEMRPARDGKYYTLDEFLSWYGKDRGLWEWRQAGLPQMARDGKHYCFAEFVSYYGEGRGSWEWDQAMASVWEIHSRIAHLRAWVANPPSISFGMPKQPPPVFISPPSLAISL